MGGDGFELAQFLFEKLFPPVDAREVAVVEGVGVLFHEQDEVVQHDEDGVRPRPVAIEADPDDAGSVPQLPDRLDDPARPVPGEIARSNEFLEDEPKGRADTHDCVRGEHDE